jgi:hypothetical protein
VQHILLTGAGFSYNWGGFLASEAFEYLLSITEGDDDLRTLLWNDQQRHFQFEDTLSRLQQDHEKNWSPQIEQNLWNLYSAIQRMFGDMALAFNETSFEPPTLPVTNFLARFDAIFTLNQDTLLEAHYLGVNQSSFEIRPHFVPKLVAAHRPGIVSTNEATSYGLMGKIDLSKPDDPDKFSVIPGLQPYFKLHGSIDIKGGEREMMLILGGDKATNIAKHPLLMFYHAQFLRMVCSPNARLMIIGYSFGDVHINQMIFKGVEAGLKVFIIDPNGVDAIGTRASIPLNPGFLIRNAIVGASRRPLRSTLSGADLVELSKVNRFFRYFPAPK